MALLRREQVAPVRTFTFEDVQRNADALVAAARAEAKRIITHARQEALSLGEEQRRAAYEQAVQAGRAEGLTQIQREAREATLAAARRQAENDLAQVVRSLQAALNDFEREKRGILAAAESGLIELALATARRVCKTEATASSAAALANANALVELVRHAEDVELHVNPSEHEFLRQVLPEFVRNVAGLEHVALAADATVARGGCVLRTRDTVIDARIETQLDRISAELCGKQRDQGIEKSRDQGEDISGDDPERGAT